MKTIALDLDGTLVDCRNRQCALAWALCRAAGFRLDVENFWDMKREGATTQQALFKCLGSQESAASLSRLWFVQIEQEQWLRLDRVLPGAAACLSAAKESGAQVHLITARRDEQALNRQLRWLQLRDFFAGVHVVSPKNAVAEKCALLTKLRPLLFWGDTESDYEAALSSRTPFQAVASGQRSSRFLAFVTKSEHEILGSINVSTIRSTLEAA